MKIGTSAIAGTIGVTRDIFDRWRNPGHFHRDLQECCEILAVRTGLTLSLSEEGTKAVHSAWQRGCAFWLVNLLPKNTIDLSHIKKAAVLMTVFCDQAPLEITRPDENRGGSVVSAQGPQDGGDWPELPNQVDDATVGRFLEGGSAFFIWLVMYNICEFFEKERTDRIDIFESRITGDFEKDMVSGLKSNTLSPQAIHLILKALFLRD